MSTKTRVTGNNFILHKALLGDERLEKMFSLTLAIDIECAELGESAQVDDRLCGATAAAARVDGDAAVGHGGAVGAA